MFKIELDEFDEHLRVEEAHEVEVAPSGSAVSP
jgi:hypothetical protein